MKFLRKLSTSLVLASMLLTSANAITEGVEYITLPQEIPNASNSVIEVWSYRCTHCYDHHKFGTMSKIANAYPDAKMGYLIVQSMGDYGVQAAHLFAYAQMLDEKANISLSDKNSMYHKLADTYFKAYFNKKQRWGNGAEPDKFYALGLKVLGIDKASLDNFINSNEGKRLIDATLIADPISKNFGTPGFVVNGKYEVNVSKTPSPQALIEVIGELLKK